MNNDPTLPRLLLLGGALLALGAGLLHGFDAWDDAAIDRAYVEAAAAARQVPPPAPARIWVPAERARPAADAAMFDKARQLRLLMKDPPR